MLKAQQRNRGNTVFMAACSLALLLAAKAGLQNEEGKAGAPLKFALSFPAERSASPLDGRVLPLLSNDASAEPRFQINDGARTQLIFGVDVDGLAPGRTRSRGCATTRCSYPRRWSGCSRPPRSART